MKRSRLQTGMVTAVLAASVLTAYEGARRHPLAPPAPVAAAVSEAGAPAAGVAFAAASPAAAWRADDPRDARMAPTPLRRAAYTLRKEVDRGAFPGAALVVGRGSRAVLEEGIGRVHWSGDGVDPERTVYDLASLTKVVATTTAVMLLVEDGEMELDAPVSRYLPEFSGGARDRVTVRHLLTHTSGLPAGASTGGFGGKAARAWLMATPLARAPGVKVEYSDVGFVTLYAAAEAAAGRPLPELLEERVFGPLGMASTTFAPADGCAECAPTARRGDGSDLRGSVHDPIAAKLGGELAGNAGLFSTAHDVARFAAMLASGGELDGVRVLEEETIGEFTRRQPGARTRALGWDTRDERGIGAAGLGMSAGAYGHTGFTGTSLWIDPERDTWVVLLTNRTYAPHAKVAIQSLRRTVHDDVAVAADSGDLAVSKGLAVSAGPV
ncbi:MAG TPA: serine hydrolase domain-containing protein, partial [Longimicrobiaceae bacterium]